MSLESDISLLRRIPLFADLPAEQLRLVAFSSSRVELSKGDVLFKEGEAARTGYVVASGGLELTRDGIGAARGATPCEPGSLIGEMALFVETKRPATATALEKTELLEIDRKQITRMLLEYPHLALRLRAKLSERLKATVADLNRLQRDLGGR